MIRFTFIRNLSIKKKIIIIIVLITYLISTMGFIFIAIWELNRLQTETQTALVLNTKLVANYCIVPLTFEDNQQATKALSKLKEIDFIETGFLFDKEGNIFASYPDTLNENSILVLQQQQESIFKDGYFYVKEDVFYQDELYGTLFIKANSKPLKVARKNIIITISLLSISLIFLSIFLAIKMQRYISKPILELKNHIRKIATNQRFSAHISKLNNDEIGDLYDGFNSMYDRVLKRESDLLESELKYSDLYENSPDMFVSVDAETGKIIQCNNTLAIKTGFSKDEIIGHPIFEVYHPNCIEDAKAVFNQFKSKGKIKNAELQLKRSDGGIINVLLNVIAIRDDNGKIIASRSSWRDITERKKVEKDLEKYRNNLEKLVKDRTKELEEKYKELENMNDVFVGREFRIKELRDELDNLKSDKEN